METPGYRRLSPVSVLRVCLSRVFETVVVKGTRGIHKQGIVPKREKIVLFPNYGILSIAEKQKIFLLY
jgi:hypothetical protein